MLENLRQQALNNAAEKRAESEFAGCGAKFQALFKNSYVNFNKAKEDLMQKRAKPNAENLDYQ
jgi:hypothetical protein